MGKALRDGYRDRVTIATKMPMEHVHNRAEMEALLEEELKKLQTDHIDFYLMPGMYREKMAGILQIHRRSTGRFDDMKKARKQRIQCSTLLIPRPLRGI